jgi:hypothetical protein
MGADIDRLIGAVSATPRFGLLPTDPVFQVVGIFEEMQKNALVQLSKVVTDASAQIAATSVLAEDAGRRLSEKIVTQATDRAAENIRLAGLDATQAMAAKLDEVVGRYEKAASKAVVSAWISGACAASAVGALVAILLKV